MAGEGRILTDKCIARLPLGREKQYKVRDRELPGFFVLVGKRRKSFMAQGEFWRDGVREFTAQVKLGDFGDMTTRGGERLVDYAPHGAWKTVTFVGALRQRGMTAPFAIEGAMNGPMFLAYVRQCLVPTLKRGETVLMDNLPVHKVAGVAERSRRRERY
jgi:hypothetical protein